MSGRALTGMIWGIKASFLTYLAGIDDAETSITDGAGMTPSHDYFFPLADASAFDIASRTGVLAFHGDVRFAGYGRMMFVVVKDPALHFQHDRIELTVADVYRNDPADSRLPLATLTPLEPIAFDGTLTWTAMPSRLTERGRDVFNDAYAEGEPFDPVHVRIPLA